MNGDHRRIWPGAIPLTLLLTLTLAGPARAQTVRGTVLDDESGVPIQAADITLVAPDDSIVGQYITDDDGRFVVRVPGGGSYRLRATRIGYAPSTTNTFALGPGRDGLVELRLQVSPVLLDPLEAIVEIQKPRRLVRVGFYKRQAKGFGHFLTPEDIEDRRAIHPADLFWGMPGIRVFYRNAFEWSVQSTRGVTSLQRGCSISVSIDGMFVQAGGQGGSDWQDLVSAGDIEALEVYPGAAGLPAWAAGQTSPCGAILIWTRGSLR